MHDKHVHRYIQYGPLSAYIVRSRDLWDAAAIVVQIDGRDPWVSVPFGQDPVERLIAIDDRYFVAIGKLPHFGGVCMAVLDSVERRRVSRVISTKDIITQSHLVVSACRTRLWHVRGHSSKRWTLPLLEELEPLKTPFLHVQAAVLRDDGAIVAKGSDQNTSYSNDERPPPPLLIVISPDGGSVEAHGVSSLRPYEKYPQNFHSKFMLSATGRYLVRAHDGSLRLTDETGRPWTRFPSWEAIDDSDVISLLKKIYVSGVLEIWRAAPMELLRRVIVSTQSLYECLGVKPEEEGVGGEEKRLDAQKAWLALRDSGGEPGEIAAAATELKRIGDVSHRFIMSRWLLRKALLLGARAPHDTWKLDDPAFFERGGPDVTVNLHQYLIGPLAHVRGELVSWAEDDASFLLHLGGGFQRHVGVDGVLGPLESVTPAQPSERLPPAELVKVAQDALENVSVATFKLKTLDEASCVKAIENLTRRLKKHPQSIIWGREMILRFSHRDGTMKEEAFFRHVADHYPGAVPSLRKLLAAFDQIDIGEGIWSSEEVSAGGFPSFALAKLDPDAFQHLEGYFSRRDPGHEPFGFAEVFPALAPFSTPASRAFAMARLIEEDRDGVGGASTAIARRILKDAKASCNADAFAEEVQAFASRLGGERSVAVFLDATTAGDSWDEAFSTRMRGTI